MAMDGGKVRIPVVDLNCAIKALKKARRKCNNRERSRVEQVIKRLSEAKERGKGDAWISKELIVDFLRATAACVPLVKGIMDRLS